VPHEFSDEESAELLRQIFCYTEHYDWSEDTITSVVVDIVQTLDRTTNTEDMMRRLIEERFAATTSLG
jgi:hypothetical protein